MLNFESDYLEGAHEQILQRMIETNNEKLSGYGRDKYSASAVEKIRQACLCPEADVQFIAGGTMTNALVIASLLKKLKASSRQRPVISRHMRQARSNLQATRC